ncbi:MAG: amino acid ABC transporter permease [Oscillospiraceae bacterium]
MLELFIECFPRLLAGLGLTLKLTFISLIFATILGLICCLFRISRFKILQGIGSLYITLIRGTPMLVQAFFIYFGITQALDFRMGPETAAIITLSLNAGAYLSETFRGGIQAVDSGQMEAARSLGLPYGVAMAKVILPQAIRIVIPSIINQIIITLKDTSILSAIGVRELTMNGKIIISTNFESFKIWSMVAVMYLVVVIILTKISEMIERRIAYGKGSS